MSLISVIDLSYQAGSKLLFVGLSLSINAGDRIGLVGHNGCGKSTLLKLISVAYSQARVALQELDEAALKNREAEEKELERLRVSARRFALWGKIHDNEKFARKAKSIEKRIEKLEDDVTFVTQGSGLSLTIDAEFLKAKQVFVFEQETIYSPDNRPLFTIEDLNFRPGDRIAVLGVNGSGKSSCIETLMRVYRTDTGEQNRTRFNPNVRIGYFDQELAQFNEDVGIADWVRSNCTAGEESIKRALIQWGFPYQDQDRQVKVLSGGEKARLLLMTFQLDQPNLLIMDEPTNHIDLQGKEVLEESLQQDGLSLLFTSHDQRFIENVATRFWWIHGGVLVEIHDPSTYFQCMDHATVPGDAGGGVSPATVIGADGSIAEADEERVLSRIIELEALLRQDQERKPKFQKPRKQHEWRQELELLYQSI